MERRLGPVIHRRQALAAGLSPTDIDARLRRGAWHRVVPSVYVTGDLPTAPDALLRLRIRAAFLWAGPDAVIAGSAAAFWHQMVPEVVGPIDVVIPPHRRLGRQPGIRLIRRSLDPRDVVVHRGVSVTRLERTALDVAAAGSTDALDCLLRRGAFDASAIAEALQRGADQRGWAAARLAVAESATRPFSAAERLLHRALRRAGVTGWRANVPLRIGERTVLPDLLFEDCGVVVEIDGHAHHSGREAFESDRSRQNLLVGTGRLVLRYTWSRVSADADAVVREIRTTVQRRRAEMGIQHGA